MTKKIKLERIQNRCYEGKGHAPHDPLPGAWTEAEPYKADADLVAAVNMALYLRRPLLLEGEPGVGKTRLAYAVAYELGYPLHTIYVRSTSRAQDMLYTFDAVRRLYDIQEYSVKTARPSPLNGEEAKSAPPKQEDEPRFPLERYVNLGKLGEAIRQSAEENKPSVVLIDEIDKADIDFPNDLLLVLDRLQFDVDEVQGLSYNVLPAGQTREERRHFLPLVIITSNREKELPGPFLRRCLFYYIPFPKEITELEKILKRHFAKELTPLFRAALNKFWELRNPRFKWRKSPSTSEFIDWLRTLEHDEQAGLLKPEDLAARSLPQLPYLSALIKIESDLALLSNIQPLGSATVNG